MELKGKNAELRELAQQKKSILRELGELKIQMKLLEESRDALRRDLIEANRKL